MRIAGVVLLLSLLVPAKAAELQLVGRAERDHFVRVQSDQPGRWIVLGPGVIAVQKIAPGIGLPLLNRRETIVQQDGTQCVFVGPPGSYAVILAPNETSQDFAFLPVVILDPAPDPSPPDPTPIPPDPQPEPDEVPADRFQNVGRQSFRLAVDKLVQPLSDAGQRDQIGRTAATYRSTAEQYADPTSSLNTWSKARTYLRAQQATVWGTQADLWQTAWASAINQTFLATITPESTREDIVDFLNAVATGLEYAAR